MNVKYCEGRKEGMQRYKAMMQDKDLCCAAAVVTHFFYGLITQS
jgi:hypothetical protein